MERKLRNALPQGRFGKVSGTVSKRMAAVKSRDNRSTERAIRMALVRARLSGWKQNPVYLVGKPDFFFQDEGLAVFVHGCFWHGCPKCGHYPKKNEAYWRQKIDGNRRRDRKNRRLLRSQGYTVLELWEHEVRSDLDKVVGRISRNLLNCEK